LENRTSFHNSERKASAHRALIIQLCLEAKLLQEAQRQSYLESMSYTEANYCSSWTNLFELESGAKGEVELNHQGDIHIHIPLIINRSSSKYFKIWANPLQIF